MQEFFPKHLREIRQTNRGRMQTEKTEYGNKQSVNDMKKY